MISTIIHAVCDIHHYPCSMWYPVLSMQYVISSIIHTVGCSNRLRFNILCRSEHREHISSSSILGTESALFRLCVAGENGVKILVWRSGRSRYKTILKNQLARSLLLLATWCWVVPTFHTGDDPPSTSSGFPPAVRGYEKNVSDQLVHSKAAFVFVRLNNTGSLDGSRLYVMYKL